MSPLRATFRPRRLAIAASILSALLLACGTEDDGKNPVDPGPTDTTCTVDTTDTIDTGGVVNNHPPGAPTGVVAVAGDGQATVSWTPPVDSGGGKVLDYRVLAGGNGALVCAVSAPATACTVEGLQNKRTYTFVVMALNRWGAGEFSRPSLTVVPLPSLLPAPQGVTATAGSGSALIAWTSPLTPGSRVSVRATQDSTLGCQSDSASSCRVTGLEFGKTYTFVARTHNEVGAGPYSPPTAAVAALSTPPGAPLSVSAVAGDTQATVTWAPPANNGGDTITGYEVTSLNTTGVGCTAPASGRQCVVGKLPANVAVSFRVRAISALGPGPSAASPFVTPFFTRKTPGAPMNPVATRGDGQVTFSWSPPQSTGASPILRYRVTTRNSTARCATTGLSCTIDGLTNGQGYAFDLVAINNEGEGLQATLTATPVAPAP